MALFWSNFICIYPFKLFSLSFFWFFNLNSQLSVHEHDAIRVFGLVSRFFVLKHNEVITTWFTVVYHRSDLLNITKLGHELFQILCLTFKRHVRNECCSHVLSELGVAVEFVSLDMQSLYVCSIDCHSVAIEISHCRIWAGYITKLNICMGPMVIFLGQDDAYTVYLSKIREDLLNWVLSGISKQAIYKNGSFSSIFLVLVSLLRWRLLYIIWVLWLWEVIDGFLRMIICGCCHIAVNF